MQNCVRRGLGGLLAMALSWAGVSPAWAEGAPRNKAAAAYVDPPPVRIHRFYVYATMKQKKSKVVVVESLVTTSDSALVVGDTALLERKVEPTPAEGPDWIPVADVSVKKLGRKGAIEVQLESERPEATVKRKGSTPYAARQKVRLQIDRVISQSQQESRPNL